MTTSSYDCIVIGAGHNGLTTAATLAKRGRKVLVLERASVVGGIAAGEEFHPGYRTAGLLHDTTGIRQSVVRSLELKKFGLEFAEEDLAVFSPKTMGEGLLLKYNADTAGEEMSRHSYSDVRKYQEYRAFFKRISPFIRKVFDDFPPDVYAMNFYGLWDLMKKAVTLRLLGKNDMMEMLRIGPMCVADFLNEWFDSQLLKATLAGPAVYGSYTGPWSPSTNANLILYEAMPKLPLRGGPQALIDALQKACAASGVEIRTNAEVKEILLTNGKVTGVELTAGDILASTTVAASCDPKQTFLKLITSSVLPTQLEQRMLNYRCRGTTAKVNLALDKKLEFSCRPGLFPEFIRISETLDDLEKSFDAVKYGAFSEVPALDISVPSANARGFAPEGHSSVSILVNFASYDLREGWNEKQAEHMYQNVMNVLDKYAPGIRGHVVGHQVHTPVDLEKRYGLTNGQIYHGEHAADQVLMRPTPECSKYKTPFDGLFLSGSGSHPGGGITCAPGALAAETILNG
jgi:phytoene dehydrogenase-like protein